MQRPLRVVLVAPSMEIVGGQSVQAHRLIENFAGEPNLSVVFCAVDAKEPAVIRRLKYIRTLLNFLTFPLRLAMAARGSDIIHIFTPAYTSYFLWTLPAMIAGRLMGKKIVLNYRDGRAVDHLRESRFVVRTLRLPHRIVTPSGYLVDVFARYGVKAESIPNILDDLHFRYRERVSLRPAFFTNRGMEPLYNVGCVLRAFALIQKRYPEASLTLAHDGPCRRELEELSRTLELRNVVFTGKVSQERMAALYDAADIYMMSPNLDNMPGTVLECYASGIPLVSTNAGGIPYIVENEVTGLLVDCDDAEGLAGAAMRLLENPEFALAMARAGHAEARRYLWTAIRPQWLRVYSDVAGRESLPGRGDRESYGTPLRPLATGAKPARG